MRGLKTGQGVLLLAVAAAAATTDAEGSQRLRQNVQGSEIGRARRGCSPLAPLLARPSLRCMLPAGVMVDGRQSRRNPRRSVGQGLAPQVFPADGSPTLPARPLAPVNVTTPPPGSASKSAHHRTARTPSAGHRPISIPTCLPQNLMHATKHGIAIGASWRRRSNCLLMLESVEWLVLWSLARHEFTTNS